MIGMLSIITYNVVLIYLLYKSNREKKIYYNNYKQCLRALSDSDPKLARYLEERNMKN